MSMIYQQFYLPESEIKRTKTHTAVSKANIHWDAFIAGLRARGYTIFVNLTTIGFIRTTSVILGCPVENADLRAGLKSSFYEFAEKFELPYRSGDAYTEIEI